MFVASFGFDLRFRVNFSWVIVCSVLLL